MACCLTPSTTIGDDFFAEPGREVTVAIRGPIGAGVKIIHIRYAGDQLDETPPHQFTVNEGSRLLTILTEASKGGLPLELVELCDGEPEQILDRFVFDPKNPARGYFIGTART